jgi:hypothetical protein
VRLCRLPVRKGFAFPSLVTNRRGYASILRRSLFLLRTLVGEASLTSLWAGKAAENAYYFVTSSAISFAPKTLRSTSLIARTSTEIARLTDSS